MKKVLLNLSLFLMILSSTHIHAQFTLDDVSYWVGNGADSTVLVVDFQDASWDSSYAWGYLHDGSSTAEDMLNAIAAADANFSIDAEGGFLNNIVYGSHEGIGGTDGFFWSTWSGTSMDDLTLNGGISESLSNGDFFGCSFTDFDPAITPGNPIPAFDPFRFTNDDVEFWVGTGTDTTLLVIDFLSGSDITSYAWGYAYSGDATGEQMLNDVAAADPLLSVAIGGGFLNDITYENLEGIGGSPNFWGTWSATNLGNWDFNIGIGTALQDGGIFGCSYTDFSPAIRPGYPIAAPFAVGLEELEDLSDVLTIYPNPTIDQITFKLDENQANSYDVQIFDNNGKVVWEEQGLQNAETIYLDQLSAGMYTFLLSDRTSIVVKNLYIIRISLVLI
jgi:hypothetical protein